MKTLLTLLVTILCFFCGCSNQEMKGPATKNESTKPATTIQVPNMIAVVTQNKSAYVNPSNYKSWLENEKPSYSGSGQINSISVDGEFYTVTALHVINMGPMKLPTSEFLGEWKPSNNGKEIAYAKLKDWKAFGFDVAPLDVIEPIPNLKATIKTTVLDPERFQVLDIEINGMLEVVASEQDIKNLGMCFDIKSSVRDRAIRRAPKKPLLLMGIDPYLAANMRGSSGALVWQNDHPVGVFVGILKINDSTWCVIEVLIDSLPKDE